MLSLIQLIVAMEMLLVPAWVAAAAVRPWGLRPALESGIPDLKFHASRLTLALAPVVVVALVLGAMTAFGQGAMLAAVLRTQAVAIGFVVLIAGVAAVLDRMAGPRAAQILAALVGWALVGAIILAGPAVDLTHGAVQSVIVRWVEHANPLLVAERELDLDWLHQGLTYRLSPLGESFGFLAQDLAWWKTLLGHVFVGSGLLVFSLRGKKR